MASTADGMAMTESESGTVAAVASAPGRISAVRGSSRDSPAARVSLARSFGAARG